MADQDMLIWQDRYQALANAITQFQGGVQQRADALEGAGPEHADERQEAHNLLNLVKCLRQFAGKQFDFFYDGFGDKKNYILNLSREFPREHVFSATLAQIAEDLVVLRGVADQRLDAETGKQLRDADKLAWSALKPAIEADLIADPATTVMTYFQEGGSIRLLPYASVALVSLPFTATEVLSDYLVLPHEVGHYVYRRAKLADGKSIWQTLGKQLLEGGEPSARWARRWKETIFADVYSCLIGGPMAALSFRDLMLNSSRTPVVQVPGEYLYGEFADDDGVHPTRVARPYSYFETLEAVDMKDLAEKLDKDWQELEEVQETTEFRTRYAGVGVGYISVEEAREEVGKIVEEVLHLLPAKLRVNDSFRWSDWSDHGSEADIFGSFKNKATEIMKGPNNLPPVKPPPEGEAANVWSNWIKNEKFFPGFPDDQQPPQQMEIDPGKAATLETLEQEPRYTWNHIFLAAGWASRYYGTGSGVVYPKNWQITYQITADSYHEDYEKH